MRRLDDLHLEAPFSRVRKLVTQLLWEGHDVGRKHMRPVMRRMGMIEALTASRGQAPRPARRRFTRICMRQS